MSNSKRQATPAEIDAHISLWRDKIEAAELAVAQARQEVGALALAGQVPDPAPLADLESKLSVARAALAAAIGQRPEAVRYARQERIAKLRQTYSEIQTRLGEIGPRVEELQNELGPLRGEMEALVRRQFALEHQLERLQTNG